MADEQETSVPMELDDENETSNTKTTNTNESNTGNTDNNTGDNDIEMTDNSSKTDNNKSTNNETDSITTNPPKPIDTNDNNNDTNDKTDTNVDTKMSDNTTTTTTNNNNNNSETKKSTPSRAEQLKLLKEKIVKLRNFVTNGCGNWRCQNPYCFSNPININKKYSDREASLLAKKMFQEKLDPDDPCKKFGYAPVDPLSYDNIKYLENDNSEFNENSDEYKKCIEIINLSMEHWDILEESFLVRINNNNKIEIDGDDENNNDKKNDSNILHASVHDPRIDFIQLDSVFRVIMARDSVCDGARDTLLKSLENRLEESNRKSSLTISELRSMLILLECPLLLSEDPTCYQLLSKMLVLIDILNPNCQKILKKWISSYHDILRIKKFLDCLQQYMSIKIVECELEIEDETSTWKDELNYDENGDADEQEEIMSQIREKQQEYRQKKITEEIAYAVRMIDIIWQSNQMIINDSANLDSDIEKKEKEQEIADKNDNINDNNNNDIDKAITSTSSLSALKDADADVTEEKTNNNSKSKSTSHRVSLTGVSRIKHPLALSMFHNSGLNETICSHDMQRRLIHRHDFYHWKEKDFFSYLQYPYLLDAGSKSKYLEFENLILQSHARRQRMMELVMSGNGGIGGIFQMFGGGPNGGAPRLNRDDLLQMDLTIRVRRTHLIEDTLPQLAMIQSPIELRRRLRIIFDGEKGIDQGGLTKEYFQLIIEELFDIQFGMFTYNNETNNYWFNGNSFNAPEDFKLVGMLMGIAVYNNIILDLHFPKALYKKMLNGKCDFNDYRNFDPSMAHGFEQLLNYEQDLNDPNSMSIEDMFGERTFSVEEDYYGSKKIVDLKPDGKNIILNNTNKQEYVDLYINYILNESIKEQYESFYKGWNMVCGHSKLFDKDRFNADELELLICGSKEFDFESLKQSVKYEDGFDENCKTIIDFWDIAINFSNDQKRKLISFITGSDRVPIRGLSDLVLTISKNGNDDKQLPTSHTCFNHLLLPEYSTKDILKQRLLTAINNAKGFGLL